MQKLSLSVLFLLIQAFSIAHAQTDVLHYRYHITVSDMSDTVGGVAEITLKFQNDTRSIALNLAGLKNGKGMQVRDVSSRNKRLPYTHANDTLVIRSEQDFKKDSIETFSIAYSGIPADGLIISKNKFGERTFFSDNWPNRAHQWIPCNDNPADKATVEFEVRAPVHYKVIANGLLQEEKDSGSDLKVTHWKQPQPIPTKVMAVGIARFAVTYFEDSTIAPVSAWVYPQDSARGSYDYALAPSIVKFFSGYIGPYPFEKLANVQSKTIFGGMENASAIFYAENSVAGNRKSEALLAHEIAHQWFGNSATERSFAHLWLSEGFATYLTQVYLEQKYGRDTLVQRLQEDRNEIIRFSNQWPGPVVDSVSALMDLLNANSYEKGSWVLHMLRGQVGDPVFQNILRTYYDRYKFSNADTQAFENLASEISGKNLKPFFQQWLFTPGIPQLGVQWNWRKGQLFITIRQLQPHAFSFPLTIGVYEAMEKFTPHQIQITQPTQTFTIAAAKKPVRVVLDPATALLFEGTVNEQE